MRILITILSLLVFSCGPIISVHHLSPDDKGNSMSKLKNEPGIFYSLPKHAYDIKIVYNVINVSMPSHGVHKDTLKKWLLYPFPFYEKNNRTVEVESIEINPVIMPDPQATYFAKLRTRKLFEEVKLDITLNGYNQISSSSGEASSQALPVLMTIASTVGNFIVPGASNIGKASGLIPQNKELLYTLIDKDLTLVNVGSLVGVQKLKVSQGTLSLYEYYFEQVYKGIERDIKSKMIINSIVSLNELNREYYNLISKSDITDLQSRTNLLKERIKFHEEDLGGRKTNTKRDTVLRFEPKIDDTSFDKEISLEGKLYRLNILFDQYSTVQKNAIRQFETLKEPDKKDGYSGVFYRVPMQTVLAIVLSEKRSVVPPDTGTKDVFVKQKVVDITVPQFGIIRSLPPTKGYTRNFSYALDPVTGALKSYSTKQKGITNEDAKSVTAAISEIEGMRNKKLERYNTELELKIKQWELQQKIDSLRND